MHETGRGYRQHDNDSEVARGYVVLCIITLLISSVAWAQEQAEKGHAIYLQYCERCHGADGRGGPMAEMLPVSPRNLADQAYMQTRTREQLFEVIKQGGGPQGLSPAMPGFGEQLSEAQIGDTVAYLRTLAGEANPARSQPKEVASDKPPPGDIRIQRLSVSIWPEYDDPRILVILRGELSMETQVPTRIRLPMPKGAELLGAGMISSQNELLNHPHERLSGDTSDTLELALPVHRFFAEWYDDPFGQRESNRQFTYTLTLPYAIAQLNVDILQPDAATSFRITPAPMREEVDTRGGKHHLFSYRDLEPEAALTFEVAYVKNTDATSITKPSSPDLQSGDPQATGLARDTKTWVAFAMLAGFAIIFAGSAFVFRHRQPGLPPIAETVPVPVASASAPHSLAAREPSTLETTVARPNYCSNCGRQLQATYVFCPGCGRPLQT